jgi:hypothetical protein
MRILFMAMEHPYSPFTHTLSTSKVLMLVLVCKGVKEVEISNDILEFGMLCEINKGSKDLETKLKV